MDYPVRRVVTGHDKNGKAIVLIDETTKPNISRRKGHTGTVIWTSQGFPVNNDGSDDEAPRDAAGKGMKEGTVFRVNKLDPGVAARIHRTDSIDYAVVMAGELDMELEDGNTVRLRAGDVLVQRGTIHNWVNNGTEPCIVAFILIDAKPVEVAGKRLEAVG
jgi:quercetin dioxygenase-like cupin family protein